MTPNYILDAANQIERAKLAASLLGASNTIGLTSAEYLLRECWIFAQAVADSKAVDTDAVTRLISAVLGFEARCKGAGAGLNDLETYHRSAQSVNPLALIPNLLTSPNIKEAQ